MKYVTVLVVGAVVVCASAAHASPGSSVVKAFARFITKETGQEATEQAVKQMTKQVGDELIERTAQKVIREGGEKSLIEVSTLVAKNGPEIVRALDNVPDALPMLKLLQELPADEVGKAASRLAAGSTGKELATLSTRLGPAVLRAEAKHPGVGMMFARALDKEGADLSLKLSADQAVQIGRHVDDIARLPAPQQSQVLALISRNAAGFSAFVGRFVEKNPGKVLFTAAATSIILAKSDAILGTGEIALDSEGNPVFDAGGDPVRNHDGLLPNVVDTVKNPAQTTLYGAGAVAVALLALFGALKVWKHFEKDRLAVAAAKATARADQPEENRKKT